MEQINNDQTIKECSTTLGHQVENLPGLDTSKISLVADTTKKYSTMVKSNSGNNQAQQVLLLTNGTQDFYITGASITMIKTIASENTECTLVVKTAQGGTQSILMLSGITLTAQEQSIALSFPHPIKVERNSTIYVNNLSVTGGGLRTGGTIIGYYG